MKVKNVIFPHMFPDFRLVGGENGLDREIKRIAVFDTPDMSYWLQGGEFIIGNGFIFKDDIKGLPDFLRKVEKCGAAAVGMKFDRFTAFIDMSEIASLADELCLPIFRIPFRYRFLEIINKIQSGMERFDGEVKRVSERRGFLCELDGLGALLQSLSAYTDKALFFATRQGGDGTAFFPSKDFKSPLRGREGDYVRSRVKSTRIMQKIPQHMGIIEQIRDFASSTKSRIYFSESHPYFELHVVYDDENDDISRREEKAISRGISAVKALVTEQAVLCSQQYHEISQALEWLIRGAHSNPGELLLTLRKWDLLNPVPCRIAVIPRVDMTSELIGAADLPYRFYCSIGHLHALLIPWDFEYGSETNAMALKHLKMYKEPVALGAIAGSIEDNPDSFQTAQRVLEHMRKRMRGGGDVVIYEDVLLAIALEKILDTDEAGALWERYRKPLRDLDDRLTVSLTDFVDALIDCGFSLTDCAAKLNIHYNTARKYCDLIEKNMDVSLKKFPTQLSFYIAKNKEGR